MRELVRSCPATAVKSGKCFDMCLCSQRLPVTCFNAFCIILCYHLYKSPSWKFPQETFFPEFLSGTFQLFTLVCPLVCPSLSIGSSPSSFGFNYCWLSWAEFVLFPTLFSQPTCIRYLYRCFPVLLMSHFPAFLCCSVGCSVSQFCCLTFNRSWISTTLLWTFLNWFTSFSILLMRSAIPFWALSHPAYFFGENLQALTACLWSRPHSFVLKLFGSHSILKVNTSVMSWLLYS